MRWDTKDTVLVLAILAMEIAAWTTQPEVLAWSPPRAIQLGLTLWWVSRSR